MAYMATPSAVLSFEGRNLEVPVLDGFEGLQQKAEAEFGVLPNSYDLFDMCGKVEAAALQRVVRMAGEEAVVRLEVRERPEWKKLRELEARIEAVASQQQTPAPQPSLTPAAAETDAVAQVESTLREFLADLAAVESKVNNVAPLVQSMALAQIDIKAKLECIDELALKCRLDSLEEQIALSRASAFPQDVPACKLDLAPDADVWQKHRALSQAPRGSQMMVPSLSAQVRRPGSGGTADGTGKLMRGFGDVREVLDMLPGVCSSPKAWHRVLKPLDQDRGVGQRTLERRSSGSRSSPLLPSVF